MAVLIRIRIEGMTPSLYDQMAPPLVEKLKAQVGFLLHVSYEGADGAFTVAEIWESQEQHDAWFEQNVRPSLPGAVEHEVIPLHSFHEAGTRASHPQGLHSIHPV